MSEPQYRCEVCGDKEVVVQTGRGFPPEVARKKLMHRCAQQGHTCRAKYSAGVKL